MWYIYFPATEDFATDLVGPFFNDEAAQRYLNEFLDQTIVEQTGVVIKAKDPETFMAYQE